jgi:hypothetical protein
MLMSMNPDLDIFAPLKMPINILLYPKIFCFLDLLAIYQLKFFYKQHNSTKVDKGYRLVYKLSCLITKKIRLFFGEIENLKISLWWSLLEKREPYRDEFLHEKSLKIDIYAERFALTALYSCKK